MAISNSSRESVASPHSLRSEGEQSSKHDVHLHNLEMQLQSDLQGSGMEQGDPRQLRMENAWLRRRILELEQQLTSGSQDTWQERQREYEALLEEKSEVIRMLHHKIQELQESGPAPAPPKPALEAPREQELLELKRQLEEEREQLQQDEDSLMTQMRQMELTMSRERAELARQRSELQRMHEELNREIEMASRDGSLRERLVALQRRQQEAIHKPGPRPASAPVLQKPASVPPDHPTPVPGGDERKKSSGLLRRIFG